MSGASSLASARRRRAMPQQNETNNVQNKIIVQGNQEINDGQKMAPLELLQLHDKKIGNLQDNIEAIVTKLLTDKLSKVNFQGYNISIKKLQEDVVNINHNISNKTNIESSEATNLTIDENKIKQVVQEYISNNSEQKQNENVINENVINEIEKKTLPISSTLSSVIENIESITINLNNNIISKDKIEELLLEVNSLKVLLIKNQTLALESSNEIHKLKDKIGLLDNEVTNIKEELNQDIFVEKDEISILKDELDMIHEIEKKITMKETENNVEELSNLTQTLE